MKFELKVKEKFALKLLQTPALSIIRTTTCFSAGLFLRSERCLTECGNQQPACSLRRVPLHPCFCLGYYPG